ncbi:hypothetical protein ACLOJK_018089 [Asimina triloba]
MRCTAAYVMYSGLQCCTGADRFFRSRHSFLSASADDSDPPAEKNPTFLPPPNSGIAIAGEQKRRSGIGFHRLRPSFLKDKKFVQKDEKFKKTLVLSLTAGETETAVLDEMGLSISRLEIDSDVYDIDETVNGSSGTQISHEEQPAIDNEISHLTKVRSAPSEMIRKVAPSDQKLPISTVKMLSAREANYSGKGRFSFADCCHVSSRYLPINGPGQVDAMNSRAYVSQFSADGTLFIAGFQGSHIRIYDVDNGWKVKKDILARSLRWTVTDTCLSPDQRYLVYSSMSPLVHIVNVGTAGAESYANITVRIIDQIVGENLRSLLKEKSMGYVLSFDGLYGRNEMGIGHPLNEIHDGLDFASADDDGFGIFSVKFSTDGRELVAGSRDNSIYVYDLEANKITLRMVAHSVFLQLMLYDGFHFVQSDVNTVCFGDETGHLIYSGSDDNLCKSDYFANDGLVNVQLITEVKALSKVFFHK